MKPDAPTLDTTDVDTAVSWDGPDDMDNPMNWPPRKKNTIIACIAFVRFVTPLASAMMAPAIPQIRDDLGIVNEQIAVLPLSIYLLGFAIGPLLLAALSETYGRLAMYHIVNIVYTGSTIGCALSPNATALIIFRFLAGCAGGVPLVLGSGTIADMIAAEKRGRVMVIFTFGMVVGPMLGPTIASFLSQAKGWRWIFYLLTILSGVMTTTCLCFLRETYGPVILARKAVRTGKVAANKVASTKQTYIRTVSRPIQLLFLSPVQFCLSFYLAVVYGILFLVLSTLPTMLIEQYNFSEGLSGLPYLLIGLFAIITLVVMGALNDHLHKKLLATLNHGKPSPEMWLIHLFPGNFLLVAGLLWYGWAAQAKVHWAVPIFGAAIFGVGFNLVFVCTQSYVVDAFTAYAASATAANNATRGIAAGLIPLSGLSLYYRLGYGVGNTVLAAVLVVSGVPVTMLFWYGARLRSKYPWNDS
ncbi:MFS general substrate transporter [Trichoderma velutinum]